MATIKDVARRVHKAIEQLNFRPSHTARALLSGSSQMIGVYIPILKGTFYTTQRRRTKLSGAWYRDFLNGR